MPDRLKEFLANFDAYKRLPYKVHRQVSLAAAGSYELDKFEGNCVVILRLAGTSPEVRVRFGSRENQGIPVTSPMVLTLAYDYVRIEWNAIVGGAADFLFCTVLP